MKIKFWGVRGSLPSCGSSFVKYGGHTSCLELRSKDNSLLVIDAGTGIKDLGLSLNGNFPETIKMLFTHSHTDHIFGFPFFSPIYRKGIHIDMYCGNYFSGPVREIVMRFMQPPFFPVKFENISAKFDFRLLNKESTVLSGINVMPIEISHPNGGLGFRFEEDGKSAVFLTDNELRYTHLGGLSFDGYVDVCRNADLLIHDAQYSEEEYKNHVTWGHSTFGQVIELAEKAQVKQVVFFHHDPERTDGQLDEFVRHYNDILQKKGSAIRCQAAQTGHEIIL